MTNVLEYIEKIFVYIYEKIMKKFPDIILSLTIGIGELIQNFTVGFGQGFAESLGV